MTALLLQTLLLMVPAFFIGAALACGLRRMMMPEVTARTPMQQSTPRPVDPLPQYAERQAATTTAAPASAPVVAVPSPARSSVAAASGAPPAPQPTSPSPAVVAAAPVTATAAANRFDDALQARSPEAARPAPAPTTEYKTVVSPAPVAPATTKVIEPARSVPTATVAPPPPPAPPPAAAAATSEMIASAAAAAAAAAAAVASHARAAAALAQSAAAKPIAEAVAQERPTPSELPAPLTAAAAAVAAVAAKPVAEANPVAETESVADTKPVADTKMHTVSTPVSAGMADDLTRIGVIDAAINDKLMSLGVTRYKQIAEWRKSDVATISQSLGFQGRIEQENWIEQAHILSTGGETYYSAKRHRVIASAAMPLPPASPALPTAPTRSAMAAPTPGVAAVAPTPVASERTVPHEIPAAAVATTTAPDVEQRSAFADAPAAQRTVDTLPAAPTVSPAPPTAPAPSPAIAAALPIAAAAIATQAATKDGAATPAPDRVAAEAKAPTVAPQQAAAAPVRPTVPPARDDLQRIGGINAEIERLLGGQAVTRYGHIGSWTTTDIERFDRLLGSQGRIARENWVEQAQILSKGGDTAHSRDYDRRATETPRESAARPKSITEAIKANAAAPAAGQAGRAEIAGLRSVRSEAYRVPSTGAAAPVATTPATTAAAAAAAGAGSAKVVRSAEIDDLKRIRGIGVLIEKRLNSVGIVSYGQIAEWTTDDIDRVSATLDFKGRIERENWVEQARILASGGNTEFSRRVDRGEVETSRTKT